MTTFKSFRKGAAKRLSGKKAVSKLDRELKEGLAEAWDTKQSKKR